MTTQRIINPNSTIAGDDLGDTPFAGMQKVNQNFTDLYTADAAHDAAIALRAPLASPAFTGTPTGITKTHVGLGNVDNVADANKPVSTPQATAIAAGDNSRVKVSDIYSDFVASGLATLVPVNSLSSDLSAGIAYVSGTRVELVAATPYTYPATRDVYVDIDSAGTLSYDVQVNGATEPTVGAGKLRLQKVVTDTVKITSVVRSAPTVQYHGVPPSFMMDAAGNILANTIPRTNSIVNLTSLVSGGEGELASVAQVGGAYPAGDMPGIMQLHGANAPVLFTPFPETFYCTGQTIQTIQARYAMIFADGRTSGGVSVPSGVYLGAGYVIGQQIVVASVGGVGVGAPGAGYFSVPTGPNSASVYQWDGTAWNRIFGYSIHGATTGTSIGNGRAAGTLSSANLGSGLALVGDTDRNVSPIAYNMYEHAVDAYTNKFVLQGKTVNAGSTVLSLDGAVPTGTDVTRGTGNRYIVNAASLPLQPVFDGSYQSNHWTEFAWSLNTIILGIDNATSIPVRYEFNTLIYDDGTALVIAGTPQQVGTVIGVTTPTSYVPATAPVIAIGTADHSLDITVTGPAASALMYWQAVNTLTKMAY